MAIRKFAKVSAELPEKLVNVRTRIEQVDQIEKRHEERLVERKKKHDDYSKAGLIWLACFTGLLALSAFISLLLGALVGVVGVGVMYLNLMAKFAMKPYHH